MFDKFLDFLFPPYCVGCHTYGHNLCKECVCKIRPAQYTKDAWIHPLFSYHDKVIKDIIWKLKYKEQTVFAKPLAQLFYEHILSEMEDLSIFEDMDKALIIPIPLSKKSLRTRGYNQSLLMAKELCLLESRSFKLAKNVLYKIRETENQMKIKDKTKRLKNLKDCFEVKNSEIIHNRNIILIDDVVTTGATLSEARRTLKKAGAKKIIAFTIAH